MVLQKPLKMLCEIALAGEDDEIELEILSVDAIAEYSFVPVAIDIAA